MTSWLSLLNTPAAIWTTALERASWQGALVLGVVWLLCRLPLRLPAGTYCWLWRIAYLKVFVALCWAAPVHLAILPPPTAPKYGDFYPRANTRGELRPKDAGRWPKSPRASAPADSPINQGWGVQPVYPSWSAVLLLGWLLGAGWQLERLRRQHRRVVTLRRSSEPCRDDAVLQRVTQLCVRLGLRHPPALLTAEVAGPFVVGTFRPAILLPAELTVTGAEQEWVLVHELAHVKRRDLWWNFLPILTQVVFFFHPLVWLAHREWRFAQEMACDALTVRLTTARAADYGELLLRLATQRSGASNTGLSVAGILETGTTLERRLKVLRSNLAPTRGRAFCGGLLTALALGSLVPWRVSAQTRPASKPPANRNRSSARASSPAVRSAPPALHTSPPGDRSPVTAPALRHHLGPRAPRQLRAAVPVRVPVLHTKKATPPKATAKVATNHQLPKSKNSGASTSPPPASPAVSDPGLLEAAGVNVGPYAALITTLSPEELLHYVEAERKATQQLLQSTQARVQNGSAATAELVPLETKAAQLDILVRAAERLAKSPPAARRSSLYAALSPAELVQFLRTELQGAQSLRDIAQARYQAGISPNTELLPLEARAQQLEILARAAERRIVKPE